MRGSAMRFQRVRLASLAHDLPPRRVPSEELEERLAPIYGRLGLRVGRLELMTGIAERRFAEPGTRPSTLATGAGRLALLRSGISPEQLGAVIHSSVCRDFLEPATASVVHSNLGLPETCAAFDLSNACLGFLNGMIEVARAIELGEIRAGLVVSGEDGGPLVEATIASLLQRADQVTRKELKLALASLTIGSGSVAAVLTASDLAPDAPVFLGGAQRADTRHVELCQGDQVGELGGPLMETDAEALLEAGCSLAARTFPDFLGQLDWRREEVDRFVTHQVGGAHRRALLGALELDPSLDFPTVETLGNVGTVSAPISLSLALESGSIPPGSRVAILGIGSGLHCAMLGLRC